MQEITAGIQNTEQGDNEQGPAEQIEPAGQAADAPGQDDQGERCAQTEHHGQERGVGGDHPRAQPGDRKFFPGIDEVLQDVAAEKILPDPAGQGGGANDDHWQQ